MAGEDSRSAVDAVNLTAGPLLDRLSRTVIALTSLASHDAPGGGIYTLDNAANPSGRDNIGDYQPGIDNIQDVEPVSTVRSKQIQALKGTGQEAPRHYHVIVEHADRYNQATGKNSLQTLARIGLATVALAAQQEGVNMTALVPVDGHKLYPIGAETLTAAWTVGKYDKYVRDVKTDSKPDGKALDQSLRTLERSEGFVRSTDLVVVISDFLGGEELRRGRVAGFNWLRPLTRIQDDIGDRLLAIRLTTPAQTQFPEARTLRHNGRSMTFDLGEHMATASRFSARGQAKAALLGNFFDTVRSLELDATDPKPMLTVPKFIFARPAPDTEAA